MNSEQIKICGMTIAYMKELFRHAPQGTEENQDSQ
jgi:hypothetical protein